MSVVKGWLAEDYNCVAWMNVLPAHQIEEGAFPGAVRSEEQAPSTRLQEESKDREGIVARNARILCVEVKLL